MKVIFEGRIYKITAGSRLTVFAENEAGDLAVKFLVPLGSKSQLLREGDKIQLNTEGSAVWFPSEKYGDIEKGKAQALIVMGIPTPIAPRTAALETAQVKEKPSGWQRIEAERERQILEEKFSLAEDLDYAENELTRAARCYVAGEKLDIWPWLDSWWKPGTDVRNAEKAGALYLAEATRLETLAGEMRDKARDLGEYIDTCVSTPVG